MADEIIITPGEVRGLGNIICPKSLSDYIEGNKAKVYSDTANINGITTDIFKLYCYITPTITLQNPGFVAYVIGNYVTIKAVVVDENNTAVRGIPVSFNVSKLDSNNVANVQQGVVNTNKNGEATYSVEMTSSYREFLFSAQISASSHNPVSYSNILDIETGCTITLSQTEMNLE